MADFVPTFFPPDPPPPAYENLFFFLHNILPWVALLLPLLIAWLIFRKKDKKNKYIALVVALIIGIVFWYFLVREASAITNMIFIQE